LKIGIKRPFICPNQSDCSRLKKPYSDLANIEKITQTGKVVYVAVVDTGPVSQFKIPGGFWTQEAKNLHFFIDV